MKANSIIALALLADSVAGAQSWTTAPPNVPSFKPAFAGQTRAAAVRSATPVAVTEMATGLNQPWALEFLPDGHMLVTEKPGTLRIVAADGSKSPPVRGVPSVDARDQGGLLDVALAPDFATSRTIYLSYSEPRDGGNGLAVVRAELAGGTQPELAGVRVIFRMQPTLDSTKHSGGRILPMPGGTLFVTLGERSILPGRVQAQDLASDLGKIVRINADGTVPPGNPFAGRRGARPEIWSIGHRNVLGAALDAQGQLWEVEMGPRGGDELNQVVAGSDYGWPTITYGEEYSGKPVGAGITAKPGMAQPVYYWDPVISPSSLTFYDGRLFPEWRGNAFIGGLSSEALVRLVLKDGKVVGEERLLTGRGERIRDVRQGPDGALYVLTDGEGAKLLRLAPGAASR